MSIQSNFPSIKPSLLLDFANTKKLDRRVTFTRSTTATYYDGVTTAKAEENLVTYSQAFDDASWSKTNSNITANSTTAPDGTTTADTWTPTANSGIHEIVPGSFTTSVNGSAYAISIFAKKDGGSFIQILVSNQASVFANFDLNAGTVGTTGGSITAAIQNIGSGWYRCSMIFTADGTDRQPRFDIVDSASAARRPTWTAAGTETVFIWGAQIEQRSAVTDYTATTTQPITNYIPVLQTAAAGVPRFDHNPTTDESLGLLIEEQRTNLLTYSEQFDNAVWNGTNINVTTNTNVSPSGAIDADKLIPTTANNYHYVMHTTGAAVSTATTYTFYAKAGEYTRVAIDRNAFDGNQATVIDLTSGSILQSGLYSSIATTNVGNGWYRISFLINTASTATLRTRIVPIPNSLSLPYTSNTQFAGDGYSGIYIWGAQLEAGAFATSYIPTVAASVTRNADVASMTGTNFSSWYSAAEGTLYAEGSGLSSAGNRLASLDPGPSNLMYVTLAQTTVTSGGVNQASFSYSPVANTTYKQALAYKANDFAAARDGTVATDTSGTVPPVSKLSIGNIDSAGLFTGSGHIRRITYYPLRVTNAQLQALTS